MKTKTSKLEAVISKVGDWVGTRDILAHCEKAGAFTDIDPNELITNAKLALIRQKMRAVGRANPEQLGEINEWVSILRQGRSGRPERKYKQLSLFTLDDFVQVVMDRQRRRNYFDEEINRFIQLASAMYGQKAQGVFSFVTSPNSN